MKEIIELIKDCRAESEKRWSPVHGFKNERERDQSNAYDKCADALEELLRDLTPKPKKSTPAGFDNLYDKFCMW